MVTPPGWRVRKGPGKPVKAHWDLARSFWAPTWPLPTLPMPSAYEHPPSADEPRILWELHDPSGTLRAWIEAEFPGEGEGALRGLAWDTVASASPDALRALGLAVVDEARTRGLERLWSGGGWSHWWPGLPEAATEARTILASWGFHSAGRTWDMIARPPFFDRGTLDRDSGELRFEWDPSHGSTALLDWLSREFPGRWPTEALAVHHGHWPGSRLLGGWKGERPVAFALVHEPGSAWTWRWRGHDERVAAMGPLGVAQDLRGQGAGRALLREGLKDLWGNQPSLIVIDWTTLSGFYGSVGFREGWFWSRQVHELEGSG
ncbi:MAG: GNAT family N-acetyltransferase [Candidatus Sericytochromatia bacterium]|nr:GNAT family N-acetyltransferase [Candidatus Sericytochromatia bacterium]